MSENSVEEVDGGEQMDAGDFERAGDSSASSIEGAGLFRSCGTESLHVQCSLKKFIYDPFEFPKISKILALLHEMKTYEQLLSLYKTSNIIKITLSRLKISKI